MPNLRYLLFLATLVIGFWNFPKATAFPINRVGDTGTFNLSSLGKVPSVEKQASPDEYDREGREARANEVVLRMKDNQRIVENLSGPVKEYCVQARIVRDLLKMYPKHDLVNDSELLRIHEDTVAVCERILDLCGLCPAIVQPVQSQIWILRLILAHPIKIFIFVSYLIGTFICWYFDIGDSAETMKETAPTEGQLLFMVLEFIVWTIVAFLIYLAHRLIGILIVVMGIMSEDTVQTACPLVRAIVHILVSYWTMHIIRVKVGVDYSQEQLLAAFDQILQRMNATQRNVVNLLAAGVTRDWLRASEREAEMEREYMRMVKSVYESASPRMFIFRLKYRMDKVFAKMEEIVDVSERILYLCRPAAAA